MSSDATSPLLDAALDHLRHKRDEQGLEAMLDAWREHRDAELAGHCETLTQQLEATRPPPVLGGNKQAAWTAALAEAHVADLPRLYEALTDTRVALARERLELLRGRAPDPRLARWLWTWLRDVPFPGAASRSFYVEVAAELQAIDDPRWDPDILDARDLDYTTGHYTVARLRSVGSRTALAALIRLAKRVEARKPSPTPPERKAQIAAVGEAVAKAGLALESVQDTLAKLLAEVYAHPELDEPRLVYADFLQRQGDPRGEFIVLQCARAESDAKPSKRERQLIRDYGEGWADGLSPFLLKSGRVFRRGFLAECRYHHGKVEPDPLGLEAWATVEVLDATAHVYASGVARLIVQPTMRALVTATGITPGDLVNLGRNEQPLALRHIHLRRGELAEVLSALRESGALVELAVVDLRDTSVAADALPQLAAIRGDVEFVLGSPADAS